MLSELEQILSYVTSSRKNRQKATQFILDNPNAFDELVNIAFSTCNKNSHRACWVLEFVAYERLKWFIPYLDFITDNLKTISNESAIRPLAKIIQQLVKAHYDTTNTAISLSDNQLQNSIEISFDRLITHTKVATKAYSIRTLFILGKSYDWIHPELQHILNKDYANHSAAYQAVAREILSKLK